MTDILVILTCYNRSEKTIRCVNSLVNGNKTLNFHFIVVDDNSNDGTVEKLNKLEKNITILSGDGNLYWAGGMRKGIKYCQDSNLQAEYVLYVNDDVDFYKNSIEHLIKQGRKEGNVVVGATCDDSGKLTYGALKLNKGSKCEYSLVPPGCEEACDTFNMNCVLVPKVLFDEVGNLDEVYIHSLADLDYGLRISRKGIKIMVSEEFIGVCNDNPITGTWKDLSLSRLERLKKKESVKGSPFRPWFYYIKKNFGLLAAIRYSLSPYLRILTKK